MTPNLIAKRWGLTPHYIRPLELDFVSGIFFCLSKHFPVNSFSDYANAVRAYGSEYGLAQAAIEGQSLPTFQHFKSTHPEYFL